MSAGPVIRAAHDRDRPHIAAVQAASWATAYAGTLSADYIATGLAKDLNTHWAQQPFAPGDVVLVAESEGKIVGFIAIWGHKTPFIDNLHVDPARRSGGLGTQLMRRAARALHETGRNDAYLWVVSDNAAAIRFYLRLGGEISEEGTKDLFGTPAPVTKITWSDLAPLLQA